MSTDSLFRFSAAPLFHDTVEPHDELHVAQIRAMDFSAPYEHVVSSVTVAFHVKGMLRVAVRWKVRLA